MRGAHPECVAVESERQPIAVRCFLALPLAEPALAEAARFQAALRTQVPDVRWSRPQTLHVTVHFFGEIDETSVGAALEAVRPLATRTRAFTMALDVLGSFPPRGLPRVLLLGQSEENGALGEFAAACHEALRGAGFSVESRAYRPHCTLGRPRRHWDDAARAAWSSSLRERVPVMRWSATRMVLYDSHSAPGGAVYTEQAELPFAAADRSPQRERGSPTSVSMP